MHYKGYEVAPAAQALPSGLFAANLVIQDEASLQKRAYVFDALDYFFESDLAIAYAARLTFFAAPAVARGGVP
jgi:hypothetical protein